MMTAAPNGKDAVGVAVVGAGMVARTHIAAIAASADKGLVRLSGIWSRSPDKAKQLLADAPDIVQQRATAYSSLQALLDDPNVEAVIALTPPNARIEICDKIARAHKHILMEKPIARNCMEADQLVRKCEAAGISLGLFLQHRFRAASLEAKRVVDSGSPGRLGLVEITVPWWREHGYYNEPGRGRYDRDGGADPMAFTHEWHQAVLEDFAGAIRNNVPPAIPGRDGLKAHRLISAIESSAQQGRILEVKQ